MSEIYAPSRAESRQLFIQLCQLQLQGAIATRHRGVHLETVHTTGLGEDLQMVRIQKVADLLQSLTSTVFPLARGWRKPGAG